MHAVSFRLVRLGLSSKKLATAVRRDKGGILSDPAPMMGDDNLEAMANALEASGRYRVLRRLELTPFDSGAEGTRCGIFLDVETTGLDHRQHEIIELALVPFSYTHDGDITAIGEPLTRLQQPSRPIPQEITAITGLTDADVAGHVIDPAEIAAIIAPAAIILAHNAAFDRPFVERAWPTFSVKPWGCSMAEVPWTEEGFDGLKLGYLAMAHGVFFDAHRAANDCLAALHILRRPFTEWDDWAGAFAKGRPSPVVAHLGRERTLMTSKIS